MTEAYRRAIRAQHLAAEEEQTRRDNEPDELARKARELAGYYRGEGFVIGALVVVSILAFAGLS